MALITSNLCALLYVSSGPAVPGAGRRAPCIAIQQQPAVAAAVGARWKLQLRPTQPCTQPMQQQSSSMQEHLEADFLHLVDCRLDALAIGRRGCQMHEDRVLLRGGREQALHPPHCEPAPLLHGRVQHELDRLERLEDCTFCPWTLRIKGHAEAVLLPTRNTSAVGLAAAALLSSGRHDRCTRAGCIERALSAVALLVTRVPIVLNTQRRTSFNFVCSWVQKDTCALVARKGAIKEKKGWKGHRCCLTGYTSPGFDPCTNRPPGFAQ